MTITTTTTTAPSSGYRDAVPATLHDIDDRTHQLAVDYPITLDSFASDFGPGAFQEGWDRQLPVMVTNHNQNEVIGRAIRAESLPDAHRLVGRFANFSEVPAARTAFSLIKDQIYPGFSFHFIGGVAVPHPSGVRSAIRYNKARMIEFGPVLAPSIPGTKLVGIRSATGTRDDLRADLARIDEVRLRSLGTTIDAALDRSGALMLAEVRRTGQLPRGLRSRCFDAYSAVAAREADLLEEIENAFARAARHGR